LQIVKKAIARFYGDDGFTNPSKTGNSPSMKNNIENTDKFSKIWRYFVP
jgi:hypothetical protein